MTAKTHIQFSICCCAVANYLKPIINLEEAVTYVIIGAVASTLPDLDSEASWGSQSLFLLDDILRKAGILKHRGITHFNFKFGRKTLFSKALKALCRYMLICFVLFFSLLIFDSILLKALSVGYCSHIILDYVTKYLGIKTGSKTENEYVYNTLGVGSLLSFIYIFSNVKIDINFLL